MNWRQLLPLHSQPAWGGLFWAVPMVYVFVEPYQQRSGWADWALTSAAFTTFLALYTLGLIFWNQRRELRKVCAASLLLSIVFMAYRSSGAVFFVLVAAFVPFCVDGNIRKSAALLLGIAAIPPLEWWLLNLEPSVFPLIIAAEALLIGAGTTFAARQTIKAAHLHRVAERERIARDLHDILGHTLSVIALKSELAGRLLEQDPARAHAEIRFVEEISRKALSEVREAIRGYHVGDMQAEFARLQSVLKTAGIDTECQLDPTAIPATHERVLTLVLREAVTNVVRHSRARSCCIRLRQEHGTYHLEVRDDGCGGAYQEGLGIRGMRARAESLGGHLSWTAGPGTCLNVMLPAATD